MLKTGLLVISVHSSLVKSFPSSDYWTFRVVVLLILFQDFSFFHKLSHIKIIFMLKHFLLVQLINVFVQRFENGTISKIDYSWNQPIVFDVYCNLGVKSKVILVSGASEMLKINLLEIWTQLILLLIFLKCLKFPQKSKFYRLNGTTRRAHIVGLVFGQDRIRSSDKGYLGLQETTLLV